MENKVKINVAEKQLYYKGEVILKYTIKYPEITQSQYDIGKQRFNHVNRQEALKLKEFAEGDLYNQAKETYDYNKKSGYPIMVYELYRDTTITYNNDKLISLYFDDYTFTGGAHGSTVRSSQTWDLENAYQIPLQAFFRKNPNYQIDIVKEINTQISKQNEDGTGEYFSNYCSLILDTINFDSYYLTQKGIMIYFQQYDIAPYSSGLPEFLIKLN